MREKPSGYIEIYRHGHKDERGELSPEGVEAAHKEAKIIFGTRLANPS